jgi:hypothetical protein
MRLSERISPRDARRVIRGLIEIAVHKEFPAPRFEVLAPRNKCHPREDGCGISSIATLIGSIM